MTFMLRHMVVKEGVSFTFLVIAPTNINSSMTIYLFIAQLCVYILLDDSLVNSYSKLHVAGNHLLSVQHHIVVSSRLYTCMQVYTHTLNTLGLENRHVCHLITKTILIMIKISFSTAGYSVTFDMLNFERQNINLDLILLVHETKRIRFFFQTDHCLKEKQ